MRDTFLSYRANRHMHIYTRKPRWKHNPLAEIKMSTEYIYTILIVLKRLLLPLSDSMALCQKLRCKLQQVARVTRRRRNFPFRKPAGSAVTISITTFSVRHIRQIRNKIRNDAKHVFKRTCCTVICSTFVSSIVCSVSFQLSPSNYHCWHLEILNSIAVTGPV
jgi:hypothetical protein